MTSTAVQELLSINDAVIKLDEVLDLTNIRLKLADAEEGPGHSAEQIDVMEAEYRKFFGHGVPVMASN